MVQKITVLSKILWLVKGWSKWQKRDINNEQPQDEVKLNKMTNNYKSLISTKIDGVTKAISAIREVCKNQVEQVTKLLKTNDSL